MGKLLLLILLLTTLFFSCSVTKQVAKSTIEVNLKTKESYAPTVFTGIPLEFKAKLKNGDSKLIAYKTPYAASIDILSITPSKGYIKNGKLFLSPEDVSQASESIVIDYELDGEKSITGSSRVIVHFPDTVRMVFPSKKLSAYQTHDFHVQYAYKGQSSRGWKNYEPIHYPWYSIHAKNGIIVLKNGLYLPDSFPNQTDDIHVVTPYSNQEYSATSFQVTYADSAAFNLTPRPAPNGLFGKNGSCGSEAESGTNGMHGRDAQAVEIWMNVSLIDSMCYLKVRQGQFETIRWLKHPKHIHIKANGGKGGDGGQGGDGSNGTEEFPNAGTSGSGGNGGNGGNGASVTVYYTPEAKDYLNALHIENRGGTGGFAGFAGARGNDYVESAGFLARLVLHKGLKGRKGNTGKSGRPGPKVEFILANADHNSFN